MDLPTLLPHVIAGTNAVATTFLLLGRRLIKAGNEAGHRAAMIAATATSAVFLAAYVTYHLIADAKRWPESSPAWLRLVYLSILFSHIVLAALVPPLALTTLVLGWRDRRAAHRRLARWAWPIWLYVSVTGVLIYLLLQTQA